MRTVALPFVLCLAVLLPAALQADDAKPGKPGKAVVRGVLEPADATVIVWWPATATRIKSIRDHGSQGKRGELIAELDDSPLLAQVAEQQIAVTRTMADWIKAEQQFETKPHTEVQPHRAREVRSGIVGDAAHGIPGP
ncbi:MAG: hypothetical protein FJ271_07475 [Planctomycetes bacterium]|nr:hypothetical protein [Planctomycetota bacterium]